MDETTCSLNHEKVKDWMLCVLSHYGVDKKVAEHLAVALVQTSLRGVDSHGVRLFPHYIRGLIAGRINGNPRYQFEKTSSGTGRLDADNTYGHAAGAEGMGKAIEMATDNGIGAVAVYNSSHFGAAAYYSFLANEKDFIGLSFTQTDALIKSHGGIRAFLGNSPLCFTAPCEGEGPLCLDMATSVVTLNKIRSYADNDIPIPPGWGYDSQGNETLNPADAVSLFPVGTYKGYGLSMMIEIFCSMLTGTPYGPNILKMFAGPIEEKRRLGHFFMAIDVSRFVEIGTFKKRLKEMMDCARNEPTADSEGSVMCPGDPEKKTESERLKSGFPLTKVEFDALKQTGDECGISLEAE